MICGPCSTKVWYVPGYQDQRVRTCDKCYKEFMTYKVTAHNINKNSVFSSYFGNGNGQIAWKNYVNTKLLSYW